LEVEVMLQGRRRKGKRMAEKQKFFKREVILHFFQFMKSISMMMRRK